MSVLVGTSGWQYASWRERFYPRGLPQRRWLEGYVARFATVEINSTFYNLPSEATVQRWADTAPSDFRFVLKASRYLTHVRRLREPEEPVELFLERARPLGSRLACVLVQLPPKFAAQPELLDRALGAFAARVPVAVELRDASWFTDEVRAVLQRHDAPLCVADRLGEQQEPPWHTASWAYIRFHEGDGRPYPCYARRTLQRWARHISEHRSTTAYVFFNNDPLCCAPRDAEMLQDALQSHGCDVVRPREPT